VLHVSDAGARLAVAPSRPHVYTASGLAIGLSGLRGLASRGTAFRLNQDRSNQISMSIFLLGLGCFLGFRRSQRPVLHLDLAGGRVLEGCLNWWESDKPADALEVMAQTAKQRSFSVPCSVLILLNWLDYVNAKEQWKQYDTYEASVMMFLLAAWRCTERFMRRWFEKAGVEKSVAPRVVGYSIAGFTLHHLSRRLFCYIVNESAIPTHPSFDRERPSRFKAFLPHQCHPSDFESFSSSDARPDA